MSLAIVRTNLSPHDSRRSDPHFSEADPTAYQNSPTAEDPLISKSAALTYISKKLEPQRVWFDKRAQRSKLFYYSFLGLSMVATSSIVVANTLHLGALSTGLAVAATIATGFSGMVKFQEHWIRYRNTATTLEALKLRYELGMRPFQGPNRHGLLIEEAEKIFEREQSQWAEKSAEDVRQPVNRDLPN
jgi:hypothetical protein